MAAMLRSRAQSARRHVEQLARSRILRSPQSLIYDLAHRLDELDEQALRAMQRQLDRSRDRIAATACRLENLSPLAVLARGYSVTTDAAGQIIKSAAEIESGQFIHTKLSSGSLVSRVESVNN
jgi:exodeoxyribonuclease VII large subunit